LRGHYGCSAAERSFRVSRKNDVSGVARSLATAPDRGTRRSAVRRLGRPERGGHARAAAVRRVGADPEPLWKNVTERVAQWAEAEGLSTSDIEIGLEKATRTIATVGVDQRMIAEFDYHPDRAARRVFAAGRSNGSYWGTEPHYEVAERAIHVTYRSHCARPGRRRVADPQAGNHSGWAGTALPPSRHNCGCPCATTARSTVPPPSVVDPQWSTDAPHAALRRRVWAPECEPAAAKPTGWSALTINVPQRIARTKHPTVVATATESY